MSELNACWNNVIRRVFGYNKWESVSAVLLSLADVIAKRFISYVQRCLTSDCDIVNYVVQYGIWFGLAVWPHLWDVVCSTAVTNMVLLTMTLRVCQLKVLTNTFYRMLVMALWI